MSLAVMELPADMLDHYAQGQERDRLTKGAGRLEALRTEELLHRWLPPAPSVILDVGGAAGRYALGLAATGHDVHLLDPVPLHVEQAAQKSARAANPLASVQLGPSRATRWKRHGKLFTAGGP